MHCNKSDCNFRAAQSKQQQTNRGKARATCILRAIPLDARERKKRKETGPTKSARDPKTLQDLAVPTKSARADAGARAGRAHHRSDNTQTPGPEARKTHPEAIAHAWIRNRIGLKLARAALEQTGARDSQTRRNSSDSRTQESCSLYEKSHARKKAARPQGAAEFRLS